MAKSKRKAGASASARAPQDAAKRVAAGDVSKKSSAPAAVVANAAPAFRNKEKPLVLCSRGITFRYRHLMTDLMQLMPHHKTDSKLDTKHDWNVINEIAELKGATSVMFFEARKRQDLYLWMSKVPSGPSARFYCTNVHTMAELKLSGNHLRGSRPLLAFDAHFDSQPHLQLLKELLTHMFVTPKGHQKSKPFFDHVINFTWADGRIWLRNYQVVVALDKKKVKGEGVTLVEVGPRVTMQPIKIFAGSFRGKVLFENPEFISPNAVRAYEKKKAAGVYDQRTQKTAAATERKQELIDSAPRDELADRAVFAGVGAGGGGDESDASEENSLDRMDAGSSEEDEE